MTEENGQEQSRNYTLPFPKGTFDCVDPETGELVISGDLIVTQMEMDSLRAENASQAELVSKVQEWAKEKHEKDITPTQAWALTWGILSAYKDFKKKYESSLMSFTGLEESAFPVVRH